MGRLLRGCTALLGQYGRWIVADGPGTALARIGGCTAAAALAIWTTFTTVPLLPVGALVVFTIAAAVAAGPGEQHDTEGEPDEEELTAEEFTELAREACGEGKGVHLAVLAELLAEETGQEWDTDDVRALAEDAGVPVTPSVRMRGRKVAVSTGIRLADLPPPPPPPLLDDEEGCRSAGQAATATTTPLRVERHGEGMLIIRDPAEKARRHRDVRRAGVKR